MSTTRPVPPGNPTPPAAAEEQYTCLRCGRPVLREGTECYDCRKSRPACLQAEHEADERSRAPAFVKIGAIALSLGVVAFALSLRGLGGPVERWTARTRAPTVRLLAAGSTLVAGTAAGEIVGLGLEAGEPRWRVDDLERPDLDALVVEEGVVCVPAGDTQLACLDLRTGQRRWIADLGARCGQPAVLRDRVVLTVAGELAVVDAASGELSWSVAPEVGPAEGATVVRGGVAYAGYRAHAAEDAPAPGEPPDGDSDGALDPFAAGGLIALDLETRQPAWTAEVSGMVVGRPCVAGDVLCVQVRASGRVKVVAIDRCTGRTLWSNAAIAGVPVPVEGLLVATLAAGEGQVLVGLDAASGAERWRSELGQPRREPAAASGTVLWSGAASLTALRPKTGSVRWTLPLAAAPATEPVLAEGMVVVALADQRLWALRAP